MKKSVILILLILLLLLNGCVSEHIINIDKFCEKMSNISDELINKSDLISECSGGEIRYLYFSDKNFLCVYVDQTTMNIKKISVICEKYSEKYEILIDNIITVLDEYEAKTAIEKARKMLSDNEKEYANNMHTLKYISLYYTKTTVGNSFTISYNEEIPSETTLIPETAVEHSFKLSEET